MFKKNNVFVWQYNKLHIQLQKKKRVVSQNVTCNLIITILVKYALSNSIGLIEFNKIVILLMHD